ncbi:MAG: winged helix-turn-helix domain-containing protein [Calditrichota bacterium]
MANLIGTTAGDVWRYLEENGETTLTTLKKKVEGGGDLVNQAVGWLARENKIEIIRKGRSVKIKLR